MGTIGFYFISNRLVQLNPHWTNGLMMGLSSVTNGLSGQSYLGQHFGLTSGSGSSSSSSLAQLSQLPAFTSSSSSVSPGKGSVSVAGGGAGNRSPVPPELLLDSAYCPLHCPSTAESKGWAERENGAPLPNVRPT